MQTSCLRPLAQSLCITLSRSSVRPVASLPLSFKLLHAGQQDNRESRTPRYPRALSQQGSLLPFLSTAGSRRSLTTASAAAAMAPLPAEAASILLTFTPQHAALGGLIVGIAVVGKLLLTGRILGIGGAMKGLMQNDYSMWRFAFLGGMLAGALPLTALAGPGIFDVFPATYTLTRMAISGLCVGVGASLGNGCTSGHGVCGNARLSPRSIIFTLCFMGAGVVSATLSGTMAALGATAPPGGLQFIAATPTEIQTILAVASASVAGLALIGVLYTRLKQHQRAMEAVAEFAAGFVMSLGLGFCGMTHPTKLAGFLSPLSTIPWDPSLAFVMGTAILVAAIPYQSLAGRLQMLLPGQLARPVILQKYSLPATTAAVDWKLVLGGIIFGLGVGGSGLCPGPDVVNVVGCFTPQVATHLSCMLLGFFLEGMVSKRFAKR